MTNFTANSTYYDNTRLSDYKACPRQYVLRHVLGWTVDYGRVAAPLIFGGAWHEGQDAIWRYGNKADQPTLTALAYEAFVKYWVENGYPEDLDDVDYARLNRRIPMVAKEMYWNYIEARGSLLKRCKVLAIEQPFAVPLPNLENCWYVGRLDRSSRITGKGW